MSDTKRRRDKAARRRWLDANVGSEWINVRDLARAMKEQCLYAPTTYEADIANAIQWSYLLGVIERRSVFSGWDGFEIRRRPKR